MMTEAPPDLGDDEPSFDPSQPEPGYTEHGYRVLPGGSPTSGIDDLDRPYKQLGGLARPDSYFGAREFDCPACEAPKGEKCRVWVERLDRWAVRHMPCLARIKKAREAGLL